MTGSPSPQHSSRIVVMGVSGCGKSTLAAAVASHLGLPMVDGDDLHSPQSVAKMKAGIALEDADRWPWLDRIGAVLSQEGGCVVACSALRRAYRDHIRAACPGVAFLFIDGAREPILDRMQQRQGHYMPATLLDSQLATLERPASDEPDVVHLRVQDSTQDQVAASLRVLARLREGSSSLSS